MVDKNKKVQDHVEINDRGADRKAARSGRVLYVNGDELRSTDDTGSVHVPFEASDGGTTSSVAPGFGTWTTADADRPVFLEIDATAETDGTSRGEVVIDIDESGGTTADYSLPIAHVAAALSGGANQKDGRHVYLPPGAQYQVRNVSDPNNVNSIDVVRELTA